MPDHAGDMPHFVSCLIARFYTVYFEHSVPESRGRKKKFPLMPDIGPGGRAARQPICSGFLRFTFYF